MELKHYELTQQIDFDGNEKFAMTIAMNFCTLQEAKNYILNVETANKKRSKR